MKYKVGDKVRVRIDLVPDEKYGSLTFLDGNMSKCAGQICTITEVLSDKKYYVSKNPFAWSEEMLEPVDSKTLRMADGTIIRDFSTGGFCDGFRGGKIPASGELIVSRTEMERTMDKLLKVIEKYSIKKEEKNLKFTFYVTEGTRVDKSCNGTIPTMTTTVVDASGKKATVTCDKADYSERQGVLEAIAQMACGGNFDKEYDKAVKKNRLIELHDRTCTYCGKVFDTVEELKAHEAWHVERKKARRERYLLHKRAKEIAFEEQAQKMAKEMIDVKKGDK